MEQTSVSHRTGDHLSSAGFRRSSNNLRRKFYQFLIPGILNNAAACLSQFLDSIVVARILGSTAMSMVNMANPLILIITTVYVLFGVGGSTIYATLKGRMETRHASAVFTVTTLVSAVMSAVILAGGLVFMHPMVRVFSSGLEVSADFTDYVRVLLFTAPIMILVATVVTFFPVENAVRLSAAVNITANVADVIFDVIYMKGFGMGLTGAAFATLTGYALAGLLVIYAIVSRKCPLSFCRITLKDFGDLKEIAAKGAASSVSQIGYCIKISFSNYIAAFFAGTAGIIVFSVCYQTIMIVSIFIGGILDAMKPIVAVLFGQEDYKGIRLLMRNILYMELGITALLILFFEAFPTLTLQAYGLASEEELALGITALRIFSVMYLFRHTMLLFMNCFQIIGRKYYAVVLSMLDGFIGVVPIALLLCFAFRMGLTGLWLAYPVYSILLLLGIAAVNSVILKRSNGTLQGLYLLPVSRKECAMLDISLPGDPAELVKFTEELSAFCIDNGISPKKANIASVACEEICVFAYTHEDANIPEIDIMVRVSGDEILMNFRSVGRAFDPLHIPAGDQYSNVAVLSKLSREIQYAYILGMNQTQVVI